MKKLLILLFALALVTMAFADVIVGTGTSNQYQPMSTMWNYYRSAAVYLGSELSAGSGTITNLQWYCGTANTTTAIPTKIYLKTTASTTLAGDTWANQVAGATEVFNASITANAAGWFNFDITDTAYNAGDNVLVLVETINTPYESPYVQWRYTSTSPAYRFITANADGSAPTSLTTSYSRPNIKFAGISAVVYPEPTNHVTGFAAGTVAYTTAQLNWTGATGAQLPGNYLIQAIKAVAGSYAAVADGTPVANDAVWTDNNAAINVAHVVGANTYTFTGLTADTAYEFKIWPYTNSLTDINFKTDGTIPTVNATTLSTTVTSFPTVWDFGTLSADAFPPLNWKKHSGVLASPTVLGNAGTGSWIQDDWKNVTTPANKAGRINIYGTSNGWLISPPIAVPAADYEVKFDVAYMAYGNNNTPALTGTDDQFIVLVGDGVTWTPANIVRQWDNAGSPYVMNSIPPAGITVSLPLGAAGTKYIAFYGISTVSNADNDLMVDNIEVRQVPPNPIFSLNPDVATWDFGATKINTLATKQFTITNTGGGTLTVNSITPSGTYYSISVNPSPVALGPGEFTNFTVQYAPTAAGASHTGSFVINDSRANTTVTLSGSCYDPTIVTFPHPENFDGTWSGTPAAPTGWTVVNADADGYTWRQGNTYISPTHSEPNAAVGMGNTNDWLITPPIALTYDSRLKWWDKVESASYVNTYTVYVSTTDSAIGSFTTSLGTFNCANVPWTEHMLNLSAYTGSTIYLAFHQTASGATYYGFGIDDFLLEVIPDDPILSYTPASISYPFTAANATTAYTNIVVSNNGGGILNLAAGDISLTGTNANQFGFTTTIGFPAALTAGQSVNIPVRFAPTSIGAKTASLRISYSGTDYDVALSGTAYSATALYESFENTTFPPAGWANPGTWSRSTTYAVEGLASAYKWTSTTNSVLSTPMLTIAGDSMIMLQARTASTNADQRIQMQYSADRITWTNVGDPIALASNAAFAPFSVDLSSLAGNSYYIGIAAYSAGSTGSIYIDQVVAPSPTPLLPDPVTLVSPADAAIAVNEKPTFSWTGSATGGVPTGFKVLCDTTNPPTTLITTAAASPYTFTTALDYNTLYYWSIVATNATGDAAGSPVRSFTTRSNPTISTFPWEVDFGTVTGDWPVANWSQLNGLYPTPTGTTAQWFRDEWLNGPTGNNAAKINIWSTTRNGWLVTPPIAIPADGYDLKFDLGLTDYSSTVPPVAGEQADDKFMVIMSDSPLMTAPILLREWNNTGSANVFDAIPATGETVTIPLTGISGTKYFAFYGESTVAGGDNDLFVDNVMVHITPSGHVVAPNLDSPVDTAVDMPINGFPFEFSWNLEGSEPELYNLYIAAESDLPDGYDDGDFFGAATMYEDVTSPYTPLDFTYVYEGRYVWTVSGSSEDYPAEVYTWPPFSFQIQSDPTVNAPFSQGFEGASFPPANWTSVAGSGSWTRSAAAGGYGTSTASAVASFYNISGATPFSIVSPPINMSALVSPTLMFDYAYATYSGELDRMDVYYSTDGGVTYTTLLEMPGGEEGILNTAGITTSSFVPTAVQWNTQTLALPAGTNMLKFTATSDYGNNLYLDNIFVGNLPIFWDLTMLAPVGSATVVPAVGVHTYSENTVVNLTAQPGLSWFDRWEVDGALYSNDRVAPLTIIADNEAQAFFTLPAGSLAEDFNLGEPVPGEWNETSVTNSWQVGSNVFFTMFDEFTTIGQFAGDAEEYLITPELILDGSINKISFWLAGGNNLAAHGGSTLQLKHQLVGDLFWTPIGDAIDMIDNDALQYVSVDLSALPYGNYKFAFATVSTFATAGYMSWVGIDNVVGPTLASAAQNDLSVVNVKYPKQIINVGDVAVLSAQIRNTGLNPQTGTEVTFTVDDGRTVLTTNIGTLSYGESEIVTVNYTTVAGRQTITASIPADDNMDNNSATTQGVVAVAGHLAEGFEGVAEGWLADAEWALMNVDWLPPYEGALAAYCLGSTFTDSKLISPKVILTGAEELNFYASFGNQSTGAADLAVDYSADGETWTNVLPAFAPGETSQLYTVDLSAIPAGEYYLAFVGSGTTDGTYNTILNVDHVIGPELAPLAPDTPANLAIAMVAGVPQLSWDAVVGANSYNIYSSSDPYGVFTLLGSTADLSYDLAGVDSYLFYHVTASTDPLPAMAARNTVVVPQISSTNSVSLIPRGTTEEYKLPKKTNSQTLQVPKN